MEDTTTLQAGVDAIASAQAGYDRKARAGQAPAVVAAVTPEPPPADAASPAPATQAAPETEANPQAEPDKPASAPDAVSQKLEDLKAEIRELKANGADGNTVRRMYGEIGNLTRQIKALTAKDAPADDELATALKNAEAVAEDYPEIAGPLVKTIKALQAKVVASAQPAAPEQPEVPVQPADPYNPQQKAAIQFLDEAHPDRFQINTRPEFQAWLRSKGAEYERTFRSSWNPAVLAQGYAEFKAAQAAALAVKQRKAQERKDRLDAAITPQGVAQSGPSVLPDEAGFERGYARAKGRRQF